MSRQRRRPGSLPVNYQLVRLPLAKIVARFEAGQLLREGHRDAFSIYEQRGVLALETR